ncbi:hypothetical protein BGM09_00760 [Streptomyces sp. CBMA29]|nr:hypothetical protein [Streptomyces sp. CBMA29]
MEFPVFYQTTGQENLDDWYDVAFGNDPKTLKEAEELAASLRAGKPPRKYANLTNVTRTRILMRISAAHVLREDEAS